MFFRAFLFSLLFLGLPQLASARPPTEEELLFVRRQQQLFNLQNGSSQLTPGRLNRLPELYRPDSGRTFLIDSFWIPIEKLHFFEVDRIPAELRSFFVRTWNGKTQIRFLVHPLSKKFYRELLEAAEPSIRKLYATPTGSPRTLLVWTKEGSEEPFFAKLSLDRVIGGIPRCITGEEIARSIGTTKVLRFLQKRLPRNFSFFPEVMGVMPRGWERGGFLIRRFPQNISRKGLLNYYQASNLFTPSPERGGQSLAAVANTRIGQAELGRIYPDFERFVKETLDHPDWMSSSYSFDRFADLVGIASDYLVPFLKAWTHLALLGITMNPHGQNLFIELDPAGPFQPTGRYLHQDFGDFSLDLSYIQKRFGLLLKNLPRIHTLNQDYRLSLIREELDHSVWSYFWGGVVTDLIKTVQQRNPESQKLKGVDEPYLSHLAELILLRKILDQVPIPIPPGEDRLSQWILEARDFLCKKALN